MRTSELFQCARSARTLKAALYELGRAELFAAGCGKKLGSLLDPLVFLLGHHTVTVNTISIFFAQVITIISTILGKHLLC
jgi:hypothetical protein